MRVFQRSGGPIRAVARTAFLVQQVNAGSCRRCDDSRSRVPKKSGQNFLFPAAVPMPLCRPQAAKEKNGGASEPRAKPSTVVPISRRPRVSHGVARDIDATTRSTHLRRTTITLPGYIRTVFCKLTNRTVSKSRTANAGEKDQVASVRVSLTNESHFADLQQIVN